jgi:hypothetical protein
VENDPGERINVAAEHPDVIADIENEVKTHEKSLEHGTPQY